MIVVVKTSFTQIPNQGECGCVRCVFLHLFANEVFVTVYTVMWYMVGPTG